MHQDVKWVYLQFNRFDNNTCSNQISLSLLKLPYPEVELLFLGKTETLWKTDFWFLQYFGFNNKVSVILITSLLFYQVEEVFRCAIVHSLVTVRYVFYTKNSWQHRHCTCAGLMLGNKCTIKTSPVTDFTIYNLWEVI